MEQTRNGEGKVVAFDEAMMVGRHRNGSVPAYLGIGAARPPQGAASRRRTCGDGELDVFSAERYFKGAMDDGAAAVVPPPAVEMASASAAARQVVVVAKPAGTRASAAASVTSASSANSRTTLLRRRREHKKCCVHVGALVRSCSGKRAVRVDDTGAVGNKEGVLAGAGDPAAAASSKVDWYKELRMQNAAIGVVAPGDGINANRGVALPPNLNKKVAAIGREVLASEKAAAAERSSSFTLVAPVRANHVPAANGRVEDGGGGEHKEDDDYDGAGSESSSDLFEIKSLMIDECSYEPSEASIQWSVTTASASERGRAPPVAGSRQSRGKPPAGGMLSGCASHRAVQVSSATTKMAVPGRRGEGVRHKAPRGGA